MSRREFLLGVASAAVEALPAMLGAVTLRIWLWTRYTRGLSLCFDDYAVLLAWV